MFLGKPVLFLALFTSGVLSVPAGFAQDRLGRAQRDFDRETDPIRKAQRLPRLGDEMLKLLRAQAQGGEYERALATLAAYQEKVRLVHQALRETGIDAERKPRGFRQMELHLRSALRSLDDTISRLPYERREEFQPYREELDRIHSDLLRLLFPRRPGRREEGEPRTELR
jgi:hypothetical protein